MEVFMSKYLSFSSWACGSFAAALLLLVLVAVPQKILRAQPPWNRQTFCTQYCGKIYGEGTTAYQMCYLNCYYQPPPKCPGNGCNNACIISLGRTCDGNCNVIAAGCNYCQCLVNQQGNSCGCQ